MNAPMEPQATMVASSAGTLTTQQIQALVLIERAGGSLSMIAVAILICTYVMFKKLRTTPNLFLVLAGIANVGAGVASVMGYDGLNQGKDSTLCQTQAFIFQWFMQADPWWSFAMAVNVFLVFFYNINPNTFRQYAWVYCLVCYGVPMITAVVLMCIRAGPRGLIFGDAVLWCWIDSDWALVRIYSYYIPVWICIFLSIIIYVAVGYHVFHHRNQLRNIAFHTDKDQLEGTGASSDAGDSAEEALTRKPDSYGTAVTEVQVTSHPPVQFSKVSLLVPPPAALHSPITHGSPITITRSRSCIGHYALDEPEGATVTGHQNFEAVCSSDNQRFPQQTVMTRLRGVKSSASLKLKRLDPVKMAYLRTSFIFAFAVLITWIPSSINRLYSLTHDNKVSFQWSVASGCVLPLQGVWNAIIYFTTSWKTFCEEIKAFRGRLTGQTVSNNRTTMRLESRMAGLRDPRETFERTRFSSGMGDDSGPDSQDDVEMQEYEQFGRAN